MQIDGICVQIYFLLWVLLTITLVFLNSKIPDNHEGVAEDMLDPAIIVFMCMILSLFIILYCYFSGRITFQ